MPRRLTDHERACRQLTEREFQRALAAAARSAEAFTAHHYDSRFSDEGTAGFPDLTLIFPSGKLRFIECKRELGVQSPAQKEWQRRLEAGGHVYWLARPSDWDVLMRSFEILGPNMIPDELRQFPTPRKKRKRKAA